MATMLAVPATGTLAEMQRRFQAGLHKEAAAIGWELLRTDPRNGTLLNLLALAEHELGNHGAALVLLQRATKAEPGRTAHWNDIGNVYCVLGDLDEAEKAYQRAQQCDPQCAETWNNLGVLAGERKQFEKARQLYEHALALRPHYAEALSNIGIVMAAMGKYQKAVRRYEQALKIHPDMHKARFNLSLVRLLLGDMAGGWREWESRWQVAQLASSRRDFSEPAWRGEPVAGRRLMLYAEQGIGDTLQFIRYLPLVASRGAHIILEVQPPLLPLLAPQLPAWLREKAQGSIHVVAQQQTLPAFDLHFPLMSLPVVFQSTLRTIPYPKGYLCPVQATSRAPQDDMRIGMVWAGSTTHRLDHERSMPLSAMAPLFALPGIRWVSLQKGPPSSQLAESAQRDAIEDAAASFEDYADTAAVIDGLDLVITVDTSVAHLAGAMGKPVWILLQQHLPDWRWMLKRRDSPWYASARLFRQPVAGDWASVIQAVSKELIELRQLRTALGSGVEMEIALRGSA